MNSSHLIKYDPNKHHRRSIRLQNYDYRQAGAYFITICSYRRECIFGKIINGLMYLNTYGELVVQEWLKTAQRTEVELDFFVVMPNHFHAILVLVNENPVPLAHKREFGKPEKGSLGTIVGAFKSAVTKRVNQLRNTPSAPLWQRNYYEHIIRNEASLRRVREYIIHNPALWDKDSLQSP